MHDEATPSAPPAAHIPVSAATAMLAKRMRGNFNRTFPVAELKWKQPRLSVTYGPWVEEAAALLREAACGGELPVYVSAQLSGEAEPAAVPVPPEALACMIRARSGLPDHPIAPERNGKLRKALANEPTSEIMARLRSGCLVVSEAEFEVWYKAERAKKQLPSQRRVREERPDVRGRGRPPSKALALREAVLEILDASAWDARVSSVTDLMRLIQESRFRQCFSHDTLARVVDALAARRHKCPVYGLRR